VAVYSFQHDEAQDDFIRQLRQRVRRAAAALVFTVFVATIGLVALGRHEGQTLSHRFLLAFWDTLNLVSTVGSLAEDFTNAQRIWAMGIIIFGLGIVLYGFGVIQRLLQGGDVFAIYARRRMENELEQHSDHIVLCGYGHVGRAVAQVVRKSVRKLVVIERDADAAHEAGEDGFMVIHADSTDEQVLKRAGVDRAAGLIAALDTDEANVYLCLISRDLSSTVRIVARAERPEANRTLHRAGADRVIVPGELAGLQMSHLLLKPHVSEFLFAAVGEGEFDFGELAVGEQPAFIGKSLQQLDLTNRAGVIVIAVIDGQGNQEFSPAPDRTLNAEDTLIMVCREGGTERLMELTT